MRIHHDEQGQRFVMTLGDEGHEATLQYQRRGDVLDFYSVFVPPSFRGRGHAGRIVIAGFEYAKEQGLKVRPTCPFISGEFLPRFPQYQEMVAWSGRS